MADLNTDDTKNRKLEKWDKNDSVLHPLKSFKGFSFEKVLSENAKSKSLFILGTFQGSGDKAVLLLEKTPFSSERVTVTSYVGQITNLQLKSSNDNVHTYHANVPGGQENAVMATVIIPATHEYIKQYMDHERFVVTETTDLYRSITLPYIQERKKKMESRIQWVYNILEKKAESERIVFEDLDQETGFILLPDRKWNEENMKTLYLQAFVHKRGIKSLRDLNRTHLPLLRNILINGSVHGFEATRAHLLTDIIDNIEQQGDYYQCKTLTYSISEDSELCQRFKGTYKFTFPTPGTSSNLAQASSSFQGTWPRASPKN